LLPVSSIITAGRNPSLAPSARSGRSIHGLLASVGYWSRNEGEGVCFAFDYCFSFPRSHRVMVIGPLDFRIFIPNRTNTKAMAGPTIIA